MPEETDNQKETDSPNQSDDLSSRHGGARVGAGRKATAEKFESEIAVSKRTIADNLPGLLTNMLTLARGVTVSEMNADGEERIYTKPPDRGANIYLIDRILGKPTQAVEISGPDGDPISLKADVDELRKLDPDELVRRYRAALGSSA